MRANDGDRHEQKFVILTKEESFSSPGSEFEPGKTQQLYERWQINHPLAPASGTQAVLSLRWRGYGRKPHFLCTNDEDLTIKTRARSAHAFLRDLLLIHARQASYLQNNYPEAVVWVGLEFLPVRIAFFVRKGLAPFYISLGRESG